MNSQSRWTLRERLDEAEMLADGKAADHIRAVRNEVDEFYSRRLKYEVWWPILHAVIGVLVGLALGWLLFGHEGVPI